MDVTKKIALAIRVVSVPSFLAIVLAMILYIKEGGALLGYVMLAFFLGIVPALAYPICRLSPKLKKKGRPFERKIAFITSGVGYVAGLLYGLLTKETRLLMMVYLSYFFSVLVLSFFNSILHVKASGHACGIFGPISLIVALGGPLYLLPCVLVFAAVVWASIYLKRHNLMEIIWGSFSSGSSVIGTVLAYNLIF